MFYYASLVRDHLDERIIHMSCDVASQTAMWKICVFAKHALKIFDTAKLISGNPGPEHVLKICPAKLILDTPGPEHVFQNFVQRN